MAMNEKILLTKEGHAKIKKQLKKMISVDRDIIIEQLQEARAQGDLSENADYDAARAAQAELEGEIQRLQTMLDNHEIIVETKSVAVVRIGTTVTIKEVKGKSKDVYTIVGSVEANPFENKISNESALAKAILGKKVGDILKVETKTPYKVEIIDISKN